MGRGARSQQTASTALDSLLDGGGRALASSARPQWLQDGRPDSAEGWTALLRRHARTQRDHLVLYDQDSGQSARIDMPVAPLYNALGCCAYGCDGVIFEHAGTRVRITRTNGDEAQLEARELGSDTHLASQSFSLATTDNEQSWAQAGVAPIERLTQKLDTGPGPKGKLAGIAIERGLYIEREDGSKCHFRSIVPQDALQVVQAMACGASKAWFEYGGEIFQLVKRAEIGYPLHCDARSFNREPAREIAILTQAQASILYDHLASAQRR